MKVAALLGNVTTHRQLLSAIGWLLDNGLPERADARVISLAEKRLAFGSGKPGYQDDRAAIIGELIAANVVILATPIYDGLVSDSLANLLYHLPVEAVAAKPIGIVAIGGTHDHFVGVDRQLRSVLLWWDALIVPASVHLAAADMASGEPTTSAGQRLMALGNSLIQLVKAGQGRETFSPAGI
jgi:NAD(P)H-dependent FMN reductase